MSIQASIIADSVSPRGHRLTTFILKMPRIILAEANTHRAFSRNSASSRAIPFERMLEMVKTDPFVPIRFQKDHKGMQGVEYYEGTDHEICVQDWLRARDAAIFAATGFTFPVTKQLRNRLMEAYMWHTVIVSATDYGNFFALRAHKDAEIHIEALAYRMLEVYNASNPKVLAVGDWHVPFGDRIDMNRLNQYLSDYHHANKESPSVWLDTDEAKRKISVARCCRVSYGNFEGKDDYAADIKLCDRLFGANPKHLSPTEHVAQCLDSDEFVGNFRGFKQFRYTFADQNLSDPRIKS